MNRKMKKRELEESLRRAVQREAPDVLPSILAAVEDQRRIRLMENPVKEKKMRRPLVWAVMATAAALVLVAGSLLGYALLGRVESIATIDVNPSVELRIGRKEKVTGVTALYADAQGLLDGMDLKGTDLNVENVRWDGDSGSGTWTDNTSARYYQVKLYRNDSSVMSTASVYDNAYDFAGHMTRRGNYCFMVRAVGSGSAKGEWVSSDTMFLTAEEADDLSYDYRHSYSGGPGDGKYVSGGPGDTGRNPASTGGPGVAAGSGQDFSTAQGNHWCIDQGGKWFQFKDGSYPVGRWVQIDGIWYCFGMNGYLRCGWIEDNGKWYYTDSTGAMLVNSRTPDGCYVGGDGAWIQ